jgi:DNA-binding NarL/FixJ family response regulator
VDVDHPTESQTERAAEPIRVLIVDDHPVYRFGLCALLQAEPGMEVVGEASSGEEAVAKAAELQPAIVLMDLNLPGINGIEATRRIVQAQPQVGVLVITMFDDDSVFGAMRAGARGYLIKGVEGDETLRAIRAVANGEAIFSPTVAKRLLRFFTRPAGAPTSPHFPDLTEREREILNLVAQGLTNQAIAERLVLSPKTVRNQVSSIFSKLQVADRAQAILRAREAGLGAP